MNLIRLRLENFQGIKSLEITPNGKNYMIGGKNGEGKSTIANAISYLLFSVPADGSKGWNPKTVDENGEEVHHLNHKAEALFDLENGDTILLTKSFHEVYTKKRQSKSEEFSGHTTDYFINGKAITESQYQLALRELFEPEKGKMLTLPDYFAFQMPWQERRLALIKASGDVSDEEIFESDAKLSALKDLLKIPGTDKRYPVKDFRENTNASYLKARKELELIPERIDEAAKAIPEGVESDVDTLEALIKEKESKKAEILEKKATLSSSSSLLKIREEIASLELEKKESKLRYVREEEETNSSLNEEIRNLSREISELKTNEVTKRTSLRTLRAESQSKKAERLRNLEEYKKVSSLSFDEPFDESVEENCPLCGQRLPAFKIEEAKEKARKLFEKKKAHFEKEKKMRLERIVASSASCSQTSIQKIESDIKSLEEEADRLESLIYGLEEKKRECSSKLKVFPPFESTECALKLDEKLNALECTLKNESNAAENASALYDSDVEKINLEINELKSALFNHIIKTRQEERIEELKRQMDELNAQLCAHKETLALIDLFMETKIKRLEGKINALFDGVEFSLFKKLVNGSYEEICEAMVPTSDGKRKISYLKASNAEKINGGLEIIKGLSKLWKLSLPIVIDNAESVNNLVRTEAQQIRLYVTNGKLTKKEVADPLSKDRGLQ